MQSRPTSRDAHSVSPGVRGRKDDISAGGPLPGERCRPRVSRPRGSGGRETEAPKPDERRLIGRDPQTHRSRAKLYTQGAPTAQSLRARKPDPAEHEKPTCNTSKTFFPNEPILPAHSCSGLGSTRLSRSSRSRCIGRSRRRVRFLRRFGRQDGRASVESRPCIFF